MKRCEQDAQRCGSEPATRTSARKGAHDRGTRDAGEVGEVRGRGRRGRSPHAAQKGEPDPGREDVEAADESGVRTDGFVGESVEASFGDRSRRWRTVDWLVVSHGQARGCAVRAKLASACERDGGRERHRDQRHGDFFLTRARAYSHTRFHTHTHTQTETKKKKEIYYYCIVFERSFGGFAQGGKNRKRIRERIAIFRAHEFFPYSFPISFHGQFHGRFPFLLSAARASRSRARSRSPTMW